METEKTTHRYGIAAHDLPQILKWPLHEKTLRMKSTPVPSEVPVTELRKVVDHMVHEMGRTHGVGVAAIQIGIPWRLGVVRMPGTKVIVMIDPEMSPIHPEKIVKKKEGCLSLPNVFATISRYEEIRLEYSDLATGARHVLETSGLMAQAIQHEIDHMNGVLFIDHLSEYYRAKATKKLKRKVA